MPFTVAVAADIYGDKKNKLVTFPLCPGLNELVNAVESVYDTCARASRPAGYADVPFRAQAMQIRDAASGTWIDLGSAAQLSDGAQLFCFQPNGVWHTDAPGPIPAPDEGATWLSSARKGAGRTSQDTGPPPTLTEKLRHVFHSMDTANKGCCRYADVRETLVKCGVEFTTLSSADLFKAADADGDGLVAYDEWVAFALKNGSVVDALYFELQDATNTQPSWTSAVSAVHKADKATERAAQLESLHSEAAWARDRVQALREYERKRRDAAAARLADRNTDQRLTQAHANFMHSDITGPTELSYDAYPRLPAAPTSPPRVGQRT